MSGADKETKGRPSARSLEGLTVLVTRAARQAPGLSRLLRARGAKVLEAPMIEIYPPKSWGPLRDALKEIEGFDWLVLTSVNGVRALFEQAKKLGMKSRSFGHLNVAAIGPATRAELERHGLGVAVTPREYVAEAVVRALREKVKKKRVLLVRASVARDVIPQELKKVGARVEVVAAYETHVPEGAAMRLKETLKDGRGRPNVITFTSSSTVRNFAKLATKLDVSGIAMASIGPVTSATLRECGFKVGVEAKSYSMEGLARAIVVWRRREAQLRKQLR